MLLYILLFSLCYSQTDNIMKDVHLNFVVYNNEYYNLFYNEFESGMMSFGISLGEVQRNEDTLIFIDKLNKFSMKGLLVYDSSKYSNMIIPICNDTKFSKIRIRIDYDDELDQNKIRKNVKDIVRLKKDRIAKIKKYSYSYKNKQIKYGSYRQNFSSLEYNLILDSNNNYEYKVNGYIISSGQWKVKKNIIYLSENKSNIVYQIIIKKPNILVPIDLPLFMLSEPEDYQLSLIE